VWLCYKDVRSRGTATDVARAFGYVKRRSHDFVKLNINELEEIGLRTPTIAFQPRHQPQSLQQQKDEEVEKENVIGQLKINECWNEVGATSHKPGCSSPVEVWPPEDSDDERDDGDEDDETDAAGEGKSRICFTLVHRLEYLDMSRWWLLDSPKVR